MANTARVTQSAVEILASQPGNARVTQSVLEMLIGVGVLCNNPPAAQIDVPYFHSFLANGGTPPYTFALIAGSLPVGLTLDGATGTVSGTPTAAGTPFTIQATDSMGLTATVNCSIGFIAALGNIRITLRGVKLRRTQCGEGEPAISEVPELPSVKRAL
jgi:hypothetical protein